VGHHAEGNGDLKYGNDEDHGQQLIEYTIIKVEVKLSLSLTE
jgi:hypothetical protein